MNSADLRPEYAIPLITSWEDMFSRRKFSFDVDGTKVELRAVIAPYRGLQPAKPCGLTNCHTPHNNGYLIITVDDRETNIGSDCGKKHFPDFAMQALTLDRALREESLRRIVSEAQAASDELRAQFVRLRSENEGAEWCVRCIRALRQILVSIDPQLWHSLRRKANAGDSLVNEVRERSKVEIRELVAANLGRAEELRFESKPAGRLVGIEVLSDRLDLNASLVRGAEAALSELIAVDPRKASGRVLQKASKSTTEIARFLLLAREAVEAGRSFFKDSNLALIPYLAIDEGKRKRLRGLSLAGLESAG